MFLWVLSSLVCRVVSPSYLLLAVHPPFPFDVIFSLPPRRVRDCVSTSVWFQLRSCPFSSSLSHAMISLLLAVVLSLSFLARFITWILRHSGPFSLSSLLTPFVCSSTLWFLSLSSLSPFVRYSQPWVRSVPSLPRSVLSSPPWFFPQPSPPLPVASSLIATVVHLSTVVVASRWFISPHRRSSSISRRRYRWLFSPSSAVGHLSVIVSTARSFLAPGRRGSFLCRHRCISSSLARSFFPLSSLLHPLRTTFSFSPRLR